jgi:hypothetical protein
MSRSLAEKAGGGGAEKRNARSYCLRCSALSIPAAGKAGNPITWNHFLTPVGPALPGCRRASARRRCSRRETPPEEPTLPGDAARIDLLAKNNQVG